jgi:hypothetical protein
MMAALSYQESLPSTHQPYNVEVLNFFFLCNREGGSLGLR